MSRPYVSLALMMVAACASPRATPPAVAPAQPQPADASAPAGDVLLEAEPLVISGERRAVYLDDEGTLHVGTATIAVEHADPAAVAYDWDKQARLTVERFAPGQPAVVLATPTTDSEDPPNRYQVFLIDETGVTRIFDRVVGAYGVHPVRLPGDATIRFTEDGWAACERLQHPKEAVMQEVVYRLDPRTGQALESERNDTSEVMTCDQLSG